jgi:hypothetical protein
MIQHAYENPVKKPQQSVQPATAYEQPEDKYRTSIPNVSGAKYTLEADGEVKEIIESISPELRNAFVILSIKNLKNDPLYGSFFKVKAPEEIREELQEAESLVPPQGPIMRQPSQNAQPVQSTSIPAASPQTEALNDTFSSW